MQPRSGRGPYRGRLRYDRDFFFELQLCSEYGIPHSQFLAWDPDDQAKAIAFAIEKAMRCAMCGTAEWEWIGEDGSRRRPYEAVEHLCMGCYAKSSAQTNDPNRNMDGITVELVPTNTRDSARRLVRQRTRAQRDDA